MLVETLAEILRPVLFARNEVILLRDIGRQVVEFIAIVLVEVDQFPFAHADGRVRAGLAHGEVVDADRRACLRVIRFRMIVGEVPDKRPFPLSPRPIFLSIPRRPKRAG